MKWDPVTAARPDPAVSEPGSLPETSRGENRSSFDLSPTHGKALGGGGRHVETDEQVYVVLENRGAVGPAGARHP